LHEIYWGLMGSIKGNKKYDTRAGGLNWIWEGYARE